MSVHFVAVGQSGRAFYRLWTKCAAFSGVETVGHQRIPLKFAGRFFAYPSKSPLTGMHFEHHGARGVVVARPGCGVGSILDGRLWVRVPPGPFQRSAHLDDLFHSEGVKCSIRV